MKSHNKPGNISLLQNICRTNCKLTSDTCLKLNLGYHACAKKKKQKKMKIGNRTHVAGAQHDRPQSLIELRKVEQTTQWRIVEKSQASERQAHIANLAMMSMRAQSC